MKRRTGIKELVERENNNRNNSCSIVNREAGALVRFPRIFLISSKL